uniref:Uncharacterized protein n=1 Tax=Arundo donax TaxID=35708 RepID=A0A0A8YFY6_ARUDO
MSFFSLVTNSKFATAQFLANKARFVLTGHHFFLNRIIGTTRIQFFLLPPALKILQKPLEI